MTENEYQREGTLVLTNACASDIRLTLEPWAEETIVPAGAAAEIAFSGPSSGRLEVEFKPGAITVYGWEGSVMAIVDPALPQRA